MKIFLSALEASNDVKLEELPSNLKYNLISYYYARKSEKRTKKIISRSEFVMVDSGAHSFQKGAKVKWKEYTEEYAEWIANNDSKKIMGFFEMDVDNIIGYDNVLALRRTLERTSKKIIPVWHKNRGISEYKRMCQEYSGRIIAITGFKNEDIKDNQYLMFLKYAWQQGCKVHCLGMTRKTVLDSVPFDFADSSSWKQQVMYGRLDGKKLKNENTVDGRRIMRSRQFTASYISAMRMQDYYERQWQATTRKIKEEIRNERDSIIN